MAKYLYGASVQGIQEFIFKTNKLQEIVGASQIIKNIEDDIEKKYSQYIMINAAGNVRLIFDEKDKSILEDLVLNFIKDRMQKAYGITISQSVVSFEDGKLKDAIKLLEANLSIQRNKPSIPLDSSINILKLSSKTAKPEVENNKDKETLLKEEASSSKGNIPKNKKNKTAIIHADGNGLGVLIASMTKDLKNDQDIIKAYTQFSSNLNSATITAFENAKKDFDPQDIREIILGGDDMTIICNANIALKFAKLFLEEFEQQTKKYFKNGGLTACAGIAYCNHKYPFHYAIKLAESLCSYAKSHSRTKSSIMFHNIQSSNFESFNQYIEKELTLRNNEETIHLDYGPYFLNETQNYSKIADFINLAHILMFRGSPANRLREWLTILEQNSQEAQERLIRINDMMKLREDIYSKNSFDNCFKKFNQKIDTKELFFTRDGKKYTPIADIGTYLSVVDWSNK